MKSPEIEVINRDNVPTPYQLRRLAMVGAKTAMQRQTLKRMAHRTDAYFFIDEVDYLNDTEVTPKCSRREGFGIVWQRA